MVYLLNYLPYNKKDCIEELEREIGWKNYGGKHHENVFTKFCQSYIQPVKFNLDYRRATLSSQICNNEVTRDEAIQILKEKPYDEETIESQIEYVSKKLEITQQELEEIMGDRVKEYLGSTYKIFENKYKKLMQLIQVAPTIIIIELLFSYTFIEYFLALYEYAILQ